MVVALNRYGDDPLHVRNRDFLVDDAGLDVVTAPSQLAARLTTSRCEPGYPARGRSLLASLARRSTLPRTLVDRSPSVQG